MPQRQNVCFRHYRLTGQVTTLTFDLEKLLSNAHSHDEYLRQPLTAILH